MAYGATEPAAGSGLAALRTVADPLHVDADRVVGGVEGQGLLQALAVFGPTRLMGPLTPRAIARYLATEAGNAAGTSCAGSPISIASPMRSTGGGKRGRSPHPNQTGWRILTATCEGHSSAILRLRGERPAHAWAAPTRSVHAEVSRRRDTIQALLGPID